MPAAVDITLHVVYKLVGFFLSSGIERRSLLAASHLPVSISIVMGHNPLQSNNGTCE